MRCLIVRFINCEGPGILEQILVKEKYLINYHEAYHIDLKIIPNAHQYFDTLILLGGPQSLDDPTQNKFFSPYYELVENMLSLKNKKVIGICLGSQIISTVLGGKVTRGNNGIEAGFSKVNIMDPNDPVFRSLENSSGQAFHLHEDTFTLPSGCKLLLSSEMYANQMFSFDNRVFAIQCHLEPTYSMIETWNKVHKNFISKAEKVYPLSDKTLQNEAENFGRVIFSNILENKR